MMGRRYNAFNDTRAADKELVSKWWDEVGK